jgi:hypothetical protein
MIVTGIELAIPSFSGTGINPEVDCPGAAWRGPKIKVSRAAAL